VVVLGTNLLERVIVNVGAVSLVSRITVVAREAGLARLVMVQVVTDKGRLEDLTAIHCILRE